MHCIHCGREDYLVPPDEHDEKYDKWLCEHPECQMWQVENGTDLLADLFI